MWKLYIIKCADESYYTGITNDLSKRVKMHNLGKGAKYTRGRFPVELVYEESHLSKSLALKREIEIKKYSRRKKEQIVMANKKK